MSAVGLPKLLCTEKNCCSRNPDALKYKYHKYPGIACMQPHARRSSTMSPCMQLFDFAKSLPSHDYSVVSSRLPVEANFTGLNSVGIQGQRRRGRACHDLSAAILGGLETYGLRKVWD
eukprot:1159040-Pelagomonas_calceolata.AAC.2